MSYILWESTLLLSFLFFFASGQDNLCLDPNDESCKFKQHSVNTFSPRRNGFLRPIYPRNEVLNLSNHTLTKLLEERKQDLGFKASTYYPNVKQNDISYYPSLKQSDIMFSTTTPQVRNNIPFIDLYGVTDLILANNTVTVDDLMVILHDQRAGEDRQTHLVKYLDLSYLNISQLPNQIFEHFPSLKTLKLNNNPIGDINNIYIALRMLKSPDLLQELDLSGCGLKFLPDIFPDFLLSRLDLSNNHFTTVPVLHYLAYSLRKLKVAGNPLSVLDDTSFSIYYNIEEISAENCSVHTITGETFSRNYFISKLNLQNNNIRNLLPDDIPLKRAEVSLWDNPWDCTCRNIWFIMETRNPFTGLLNPHRMSCSTPMKYANRPLYEVAEELEQLEECDSFVFKELHRPQPPAPNSPPDSHSFVSFMSMKTMTNLIIIAGLLAVIITVVAVVLIRKVYYKTRQQIYKPLQNILKHRDTDYLDEKSIQHI